MKGICINIPHDQGFLTLAYVHVANEPNYTSTILPYRLAGADIYPYRAIKR